MGLRVGADRWVGFGFGLALAFRLGFALGWGDPLARGVAGVDGFGDAGRLAVGVTGGLAVGLVLGDGVAEGLGVGLADGVAGREGGALDGVPPAAGVDDRLVVAALGTGWMLGPTVGMTVGDAVR